MSGIYLKIAGKKQIVIRSLWVALVVGIILNLINEWTILISGNFSEMNMLTVSLTFVVPYLVSTFSSVLSKLSLHTLPLPDQKEKLDSFLKDWMNGTFQLDDILVVGIRL